MKLKPFELIALAGFGWMAYKTAKNRQQTTDGVGLLISWDGMESPENIEQYSYPAWTPQLKALSKAGKIRCYYNGSSYAIYTIPTSKETRVYHLACVIYHDVVYWARRIRTDEATRKALTAALHEEFSAFVQPSWSSPETRWVYL